jgi:hypothetical protein
METNVAQSAGSKASLADLGRIVYSHDMSGLPEELAGLALSAFFHLHSKSGVLDRGLVFLGEVKLALLIETRVGVSLT